MVRWTIAIVSLSFLCLVGCAPTIPQLIEMRQISGADTALGTQEKIISYFAQPSDDAVWRAEAMQTMAHIDATFSHASFYPGVHRDVQQLLMDEYSRPKTTDNVRSGDIYRLRAWSVHMLSRLDRPYFLEFYLDVLDRHNKRTDGRYDIRLAAVNGILSEMSRLSRYKGLRQRLLSQAAALKAEIRIGVTENERQILSAIQTIENGLLSYGDIVDLLPDEPDEISSSKLLELLTWNQAALLAGQHTESNDKYETNKLKLLGLIHHHDKAVRLRAREILADVDPYPLFKKMAPYMATSPKAVPSDYIQTMRLIAILEPKMKAQEEYRKLRSQAVDAFFAKLKIQSPEVRIEAYTALTKADPALLAAKLIEANKAAMSDDRLDVALLQIDFLNRLRAVPAFAKDTAQQAALIRAIGDWMNVPSMAIRTRVTAILLKDAPEALVLAIGRRLPNIALESTEPAQYLVEAYISALTKLEKNVIDADFEKAVLREFGVTPYRLLLDGLAKESYEIRSIIANFMSTHNPSAFAEVMAGHLKNGLPVKGTEQFRILGLLGDFAIKHSDTIRPNQKKLVLAALRKGLKVNNEDTILLCCRYIIELGGEVKETDLARPIPSVKALIQLAKKEVK